MNELISIVIPAYNIQDYLGPTLDSILVQIYENMEIIIVNDGSNDGTGAIADAYANKDGRIRVIHKENGGVTSARLRGVAEAKGAYIGFVDGDDYIEPNMYQRLMENLQKYDADISHCGYQMVFPGRVDYYHNTGKLVEQDHDTGLQDLISGGLVEPALWNKLFRRELFDGLADKMDFTIKINEDVLMNYWLFDKAQHSVFEDICPYHYVLRQGSAATSKVNKHKLWDPLHVTQMIFDNAPDVVKPVAFQRLIRQLISGATMDIAENPELIKPFRNYSRKELREQLKAVLLGGECGVALKIMALWASIWPWSYSAVHKLYARIRGTDKKYEIS